MSLREPLVADVGRPASAPHVDEPAVGKTGTWQARHEVDGEGPPSSGKDLWNKAKKKMHHVHIVKTTVTGLRSLAKETAFMKSKSAQEQQKYVAMIMVVVVISGVATSMTKSALFHMKAAGRWDDGHPYLFGYALSLTMIVFIMKVGMVFLKRMIKSDEEEDEDMTDTATESHEQLPALKRFWNMIVPYVLLVTFTFFEMLSATVASLGLLYGAPTSVFVIFKSSKTIFLAVLSVVILRRRLNVAQWSALLFISLALLLATCAEGKDTKKGAEFNLLGPGLLLLSELFHAFMLILQEVSVQNYWSDPLELLSASAVIGVIMTGTTMYKMKDVWITLPDGGHRPASDPVDSVYMCFANPVLGAVWLTHLFVHVGMDVSHIVILKHISALARTLCDAIKLILMWCLGKAFWFLSIAPVLAEPWHPGLIGSWLMLPSIGIIIYSMMMFKNGVFCVFKFSKEGVEADLDPEKASVKVDLDEQFFVSMFTSRKMEHKLKMRKVRRARSMV